MRRELHLLTFGWYERFAASLAHTGHRWDLVPRRTLYGFRLKPHGLPPNIEVVSPARARQRARGRRYHAVVAQTLYDLHEYAGCDLPCVFVAHAPPVDAADRALLADLRTRTRVVQVAVSDRVRHAWRMEAHVIPYGLDPKEYEPSQRDRAVILTAGAGPARLGAVDPGDWLETVVSGLPLAVHEPDPHLGVPAAGDPSLGFLDLCRHSRAYLKATRTPAADGWTYSMLEAMACALPVVTRSSDSDLIIDGANGYVADDPSRMRERLLELLEDLPLGSRLGLGARATIVTRFPVEPFLTQWCALLADFADRPGSSHSAKRAARSAVDAHSSPNTLANRPTSAP